MIHYHGTPITPASVLATLAGRHFCVSFAAPAQVAVCHEIGQSVMLDSGAFTAWTQGRDVDWHEYARWATGWLDYQTTWYVLPDVIDGDEHDNDHLLAEWFRKYQWAWKRGAPVWHMHESIDRLKRLAHAHERVCFGSSAQYRNVGDDLWRRRMDQAMNAICNPEPPCWLHMLRGMSLSGDIYPFASVDSTDVARNHNRAHNTALEMASRWDAKQTPARWIKREQLDLLEAA